MGELEGPVARSGVAYWPDAAAAWSWRHRWQLAPLAGTAGVVCAAGTPVLAATSGLLLAGAAEGTRRLAVSGRAFRGRMLLSVRERQLLAAWLGASSGWLLWSAVPVLPGAHNVLLLVVSTIVPSWGWVRSRRIRRTAPALSPGALAVVDRWTEAVAVRGPSALLGSTILVPTMREPADGAYAFTVQLAADVHAKDAAAEAVRRGIESQLKLPLDTALVSPDRDDATRLLVTLTPARHLEAEAQAWPGPVLLEDGGIPLAVTPDGQDIAAALFNEDGVEHALIVGTSGAGKSSTTAAFALPGPTAGYETLWYLDGKEGGSAPYLQPACDWYLDDRALWGAAIDAAYRVLQERKRRRKGKHKWHTPTETDPILTLLIDEATTVATVLKPHHHGKLLEILREGRSLGVRVIQIAQDPMGTDLIGGRKARDLMGGNGTVVAHRMGGSQASRIAIDSTSDKTLDLTALPAEPGFAAIIRRGRVLAKVARVRYASDTAAADAAAQVNVRPLGPEDAEAAGTAYLDRPRPNHPHHPDRRGNGQEEIDLNDLDDELDDRFATDELDDSAEDFDDDSDTESGSRTGGDLAGVHEAVNELADELAGARASQEAGAANGREVVSGTTRLARDVVHDALTAVAEPVTRGWLSGYTGLAPATVTRALVELEAEERARRAPRQRWEAIP